MDNKLAVYLRRWQGVSHLRPPGKHGPRDNRIRYIQAYDAESGKRLFSGGCPQGWADTLSDHRINYSPGDVQFLYFYLPRERRKGHISKYNPDDVPAFPSVQMELPVVEGATDPGASGFGGSSKPEHPCAALPGTSGSGETLARGEDHTNKLLELTPFNIPGSAVARIVKCIRGTSWPSQSRSHVAGVGSCLGVTYESKTARLRHLTQPTRF